MPIIVNSPHSGRPVKVRDQDVGRAVRDEAGRIFFVLPAGDGKGHYGSKTRKPGRDAHQGQTNREEAPKVESDVAAHDITGRRRTRWRVKLLITAVVLIVAVLAYLFSPYGPLSIQNLLRGTTPRTNPTPTDPSAEPGEGASKRST